MINSDYAIFALILINNNNTVTYNYNISIQLQNNNIVTASVDEINQSLILPPNKVKYLPIIFNCLSIGFIEGNVVFSVAGYNDVFVPLIKLVMQVVF